VVNPGPFSAAADWAFLVYSPCNRTSKLRYGEGQFIEFCVYICMFSNFRIFFTQQHSSSRASRQLNIS
jgi:hypothetical protein